MRPISPRRTRKFVFPNFGHFQFPPQQTSNKPASSLFLKFGHVPTSTTTDVKMIFRGNWTCPISTPTGVEIHVFWNATRHMSFTPIQKFTLYRIQVTSMTQFRHNSRGNSLVTNSGHGQFHTRTDVNIHLFREVDTPHVPHTDVKIRSFQCWDTVNFTSERTCSCSIPSVLGIHLFWNPDVFRVFPERLCD